MAAAVDEAGHGGADYQKWEFDAPQFHDFSLGSPEGENPDDWFHTSATRGENVLCCCLQRVSCKFSSSLNVILCAFQDLQLPPTLMKTGRHRLRILPTR